MPSARPMSPSFLAVFAGGAVFVLGTVLAHAETAADARLRQLGRQAVTYPTDVRETAAGRLAQNDTPSPPFQGTVFIDPDVITPSDPTSLSEVTYAGRGERTMFDRRPSDWVELNAYLFNARFDDELSSEIQVNPEFGSVLAAEAAANKYARMIGQLPTVLRNDVETVWIHKGEQLWGGGNDNILIHVDQYVHDPFFRDFEEEALVHEAGHTSLDGEHAEAPNWLAAQAADGGFISTYARDDPKREDVAESVLPWLAVRYRSNRISGNDEQKILDAIPNRLVYFDREIVRQDMYPITERVSDSLPFFSRGLQQRFARVRTHPKPVRCRWRRGDPRHRRYRRALQDQ